MSAPPAEAEQLQQSSPPRSSPFSLGFRQPAEETTPDLGTIPSPASSPETDGDEWAPASEHDEMPDAPSESPAATSSRGSTPVADGLRDMFRNGVIIASHQAHTYLGARSEGQRQAELYLADTDDAANIGDPLSRIAARRDGVGEMSPDTQDLMAAMMGLAGYASKQIQRQQTAKKIDARMAAGVTTPAEDV